MDGLPADLKAKIGRKGDPRMCKALIAKLNDPDLSLHDAIMLGGFDYPVVEKDDKSSKYSMIDSDGIFLGQRKNQLSRRLREAKIIIDKYIQEHEAGETKAFDAVDDTKHASRETPITFDNNLSANKEEKYLQKNYFTPLATHSASISHEESSSFGKPILVRSSSQPLQCAVRMITEKAKNIVSSEGSGQGSFGSIFSGKLKDFDSFNVPKIPTPVETHSLCDSSKTLQTITNACKYEIDDASQSSSSTPPLNTKAYGFNTDNTNKKSYSNTPDAIEKNPNITHHRHKDENDENNSINTNSSLNPCNTRSDPLLKKAIDIFDSNINNFLLSVMTKAGYSPDMITDQSMEFLTVMASTVKTRSERTEQVKYGSTVSFSSNKCIPLKKRRHANTSNNTKRMKSANSDDLSVLEKSCNSIPLNGANEASTISELTFDHLKIPDLFNLLKDE